MNKFKNIFYFAILAVVFLFSGASIATPNNDGVSQYENADCTVIATEGISDSQFDVTESFGLAMRNTEKINLVETTYKSTRSTSATYTMYAMVSSEVGWRS